MRLGVLFLVVLLSAPAWSRGHTRPSSVNEVRSELASGNFARAVKKANAALKRATDPAEVAQLQLARGQAYLALGKTELAKAAFVAAIQKDSSVELDATTASPDAVNLFEKARAEFPATLAIAVTNGAADLTIDDRAMGPAPLEMEVDAGTHHVEAKSSDGRTVTKDVRVGPGRKVRVELELTAPQVAPAPVAQTPVERTGGAARSQALVPPPPPPPSVVEQHPAQRRSLVGLVPLVGGVLVAGGGAVGLWQASVQNDLLVNPGRPKLSPAEEQAAISNGKLFQTLGWIGVGVGAAAVVTSALLFALMPGSEPPSSDDSDLRMSILTGAGGEGFLVLSGRF